MKLISVYFLQEFYQQDGKKIILFLKQKDNFFVLYITLGRLSKKLSKKKKQKQKNGSWINT